MKVWGPFLLWSGKLLYSHFTFLRASHIEEISFPPLPYKRELNTFKAEGGRRFLRCGTHVKKWSRSTRVSHSTTKTAPTEGYFHFYFVKMIFAFFSIYARNMLIYYAIFKFVRTYIVWVNHYITFIVFLFCLSNRTLKVTKF